MHTTLVYIAYVILDGLLYLKAMHSCGRCGKPCDRQSVPKGLLLLLQGGHHAHLKRKKKKSKKGCFFTNRRCTWEHS